MNFHPTQRAFLALALSLSILAAGCGEKAVADPAPTPAKMTAAEFAPRPLRATRSPKSVVAPRRASPLLPPDPPATPPADVTPQERSLYRLQCAACHGDEGRGDGALAAELDPLPRDFGSGAFKLRDTKSGLPTDAALERVISRGMPGSAMPASVHLTTDAVTTIARVVRRLAFEAKVADLLTDDDELSANEARNIAADLQIPGAIFDIPERPAKPPDTPPERTFAFYCTECHGADGTAADAVESELRDYAGRPIRARDLTREPLKGGNSHEDLIRRIYLGIPGTPMPETTAMTENLWALADHVLALRADAAADVPVGATIPASADGAAAASARLPLYPLRGDGDDPLAVEVSVARAEAHLVVRVAWDAVENPDEGSAAGAAFRLSARADAGFPWTADNVPISWRAKSAADDVGVATRDGERFVVEATLNDGAESARWLAITIWERPRDGAPTRSAFTTWHALVTPE